MDTLRHNVPPSWFSVYQGVLLDAEVMVHFGANCTMIIANNLV
ncbi:Uncharacterised protein [Paenibacillus polymyxa]|nr:Uncharacterised protein [Paenibacillus polymyxa]